MEVLEVSPTSAAKMESAHSSSAKAIQGLPKQTCDPVPLATVGWLSLQSHIDIMRIVFLWKLLMVPMQVVYKRVTLDRLVYHLVDDRCGRHAGPIHLMLEACRKYGLEHYINKVVWTGAIFGLDRWKTIVKNAVWEREQNCWRASTLMYKKLDLFSISVGEIGRWVWWTYARRRPGHTWKCRLLLRLMVGEHRLQDNMVRVTRGLGGVTPAVCQLCTSFEQENLQHMLFQCVALQETRVRLWGEVEAVAPPALTLEMNSLGARERTIFILAGFRSGYIPEWEDTYKAILSFVVNMYIRRSDYVVTGTN